jgi:hypothetical protein
MAGRRIRRWLAPCESEFVRIKSSPSDKGRTAGSPASLAVTVGDSIGISPSAISNRAAQAASFYRAIWLHAILPRRDDAKTIGIIISGEDNYRENKIKNIAKPRNCNGREFASTRLLPLSKHLADQWGVIIFNMIRPASADK